MGQLKMHEWKMREQIAGVENTGVGGLFISAGAAGVAVCDLYLSASV